MAIDRAAARQRVRAITGWAAAGAVALTAGFAVGAARGGHAATARRSAALSSASARQDDQAPTPDQGFTPPAASNAPPAAMSGGS